GYQQRLGARAFEINDLRIHGRVAYLVRGDDDLPVEIALEKRLEGVDIVLTEVVILIKDRILRVRKRPGQELGVDLSFGVEADEAGRRQRKIRNIRELVRSRDDGDCGYTLRDQVFRRRRIAGRAKLAEHEGHFVAFDELACMLYRLRRAIGIIISNVVYLPT